MSIFFSSIKCLCVVKQTSGPVRFVFVQEHCLLVRTEDELFLMVFPTREFSSLVVYDCHPGLARYVSSSEHLSHVIVFH